MAVQVPSLLTAEEYLERERSADTKSEYVAGQVYAMAGASHVHNRIAANLVAALHAKLRGGPCEALASDMRVRTSAAHYTYSDVVILCGQPVFLDGDMDTLENPIAVIEVLSPSTERWDRGGKFERYRRVDSLKQYILVAQDRSHIEVFTRQADDTWLLSEFDGMDAVLNIASAECTIRLEEVYERVSFSDAEGEIDAGRPV